MKRLLALFRNARGSATIEFAFASLFLFSTIMVALDFGYAAEQRLKLSGAVQQAAVMAFDRQTGSDTASIGNYIVAAAHLKSVPSVSVTCNGGNACGDGKCSCITAGGGFTPADACNTPCAGSNAISGNYMRIAATSTYNSVIVPDKWLGGKVISSSAVIRLQ